MGLGDPDLMDDKGYGEGERGVGSEKAASAQVVSCSICFDAVTNGGDRSTARLQCGHQFHLDCIGSAFNAKGAMQCPNCRKVEKGNWLFSNGYRPIPEINMEDLMHEDDLYDFTYSELHPYGVHWCPFSRLARVPFPYEEGEYTPPVTHHELLGRSAVFAEHPPTASASHPCPYMAYIHPLQPSSSSSSQVSNEAISDGSSFQPWNGHSGPVDILSSHPFPAVDVHHQSWNPHSPPSNHVNAAEQTSVPSTSRAPRLGSDVQPRPVYLHSFIFGQGSTSRASSSAMSSMVPHYVGNSRPHARHEHHASYQQSTPGVRGHAFSGPRRTESTRGMVPTGPALPSDHGGFFLFSPAAASSRTPVDAEANGGNHFYAWERDSLAPFPLLPVDREFPYWGLPPQTPAGSDPSNRPGFWSRNGTERSSSQPRSAHHPRLHPFI